MTWYITANTIQNAIKKMTIHTIANITLSIGDGIGHPAGNWFIGVAKIDISYLKCHMTPTNSQILPHCTIKHNGQQ